MTEPRPVGDSSMGGARDYAPVPAGVAACVECGDDDSTEGFDLCMDCLETLHPDPAPSGLTAGSLFAGIGGFDLGFERAGIRTAWQAENDKKCNEVLARWWPTVTRYEDVRDVGSGSEPVDLVCGGFPCQDVSIAAGDRAGLAGGRSGLWWEFHRILAELGPRWVVIENVPGLMSSNGGRDMGAVLGALGDLGYGWAYRVLDAQWFGVAQRRRRLFVVGCLGDPARAAQVLLEPEGGRGDPPARDPSRSSIARAVDASPGGGVVATPYRKSRRAATSEDYETWVVADFANTLTGFDAGEVRSTHVVVEGDAVRRLTPVEWSRLQGFPDDWSDHLPDGARCNQFGNAVAVPVAEWIGRRIVAQSRVQEVAA